MALSQLHSVPHPELHLPFPSEPGSGQRVQAGGLAAWRPSARLWGHLLTVALCLTVAYVGRRDVSLAHPVEDERGHGSVVSNLAAPRDDYLAGWPGAITGAPASTAVASQQSRSTFGFLSVLGDVPLTMSSIIDGGASRDATGPGLSAITYVVEDGDTLWSIARHFDVSPESIAAANGINLDSGVLSVGQKLQVPPVPGFLHVVKDGDTLDGIAHLYGISADDLARVNSISDPTALQVGQTLVVPGGTLPRRQPAVPQAPVLASRSYVVKDGDSVSSIAVALGSDAEAIIAANHLEPPYLLQPGQTLAIPDSAATSGVAASGNPTGSYAERSITVAATARPSLPSTYTIRPGDTISRIASTFGISPGAIISRNQLANPSLIQPGEHLVLGATPRPEPTAVATPAPEAPASASTAARAAPPPPAPTATPTPKPTPAPAPAPAPARVASVQAPRVVARSGWSIVAIASKFLGYPYVWGGTSPSPGFDCSGFVWYVYQAAGIPIPRELSGQLASGARIPRSELQAGDIVFFVDTYKPGLSHDGIYLGGGRFINAADYGIGVTVSSLSDSYWAQRYVAATRPW